MKKQVIYLFSLIAYLLIVCTVLSIKIEEEMVSQVEIISRRNKGDIITLNQSVLFADDSGQHLYVVFEGSGWDEGLRSQELTGWSIAANDAVQFYGYEDKYTFVASASRTPLKGEEVAVIEEFTNGEDQYLCLYSDGVPEEFVLPNNARIISQTENAVWLELSDAQFPFFEHRAKNVLKSINTPDMRVFSLTEVEVFLNQLPLLMVLAMQLIVPVILWGASFVFSGWQKGRFVVWLNFGIIILAMCILPQVLTRIDLPASLLPGENILNVSYYWTNFSAVFNALEELEIYSLIKIKENVISQVIRVWKTSCGAAGGLIFIETTFLYMKSCVHIKKYVGKYLSSNQ